MQTPSNVPLEVSPRDLSKPFSLRVSPPCFGQKRLRTAHPSGCYLEWHTTRYHADKAQNNKKTVPPKDSAHLRMMSSLSMRWDPCCRTLKVIARAAYNDSPLKAFRCRADFWGYSWWTRKRCAEHWRESGVVRTGEKQTVEGGAKQRSSSRCVTKNNPNPANDRSLLLLSSGCNAHVQKTIWFTALYASPQTGGNPPLHKQ